MPKDSEYNMLIMSTAAMKDEQPVDGAADPRPRRNWAWQAWPGPTAPTDIVLVHILIIFHVDYWNGLVNYFSAPGYYLLHSTPTLPLHTHTETLNALTVISELSFRMQLFLFC